MILSTGEQFEAEDFGLDLQLAPGKSAGIDTAPTSNGPGDDLNLENIERETVRTALTRNRYNISHAAKDLGITRAALYRRMEKHGL